MSSFCGTQQKAENFVKNVTISCLKQRRMIRFLGSLQNVCVSSTGALPRRVLGAGVRRGRLGAQGSLGADRSRQRPLSKENTGGRRTHRPHIRTAASTGSTAEPSSDGLNLPLTNCWQFCCGCSWSFLCFKAILVCDSHFSGGYCRK